AGFVDDLVAVVILFQERLITGLIQIVNPEKRQCIRIDDLMGLVGRQEGHVLIRRGVDALAMADSVTVFGIILIHAGERVVPGIFDFAQVVRAFGGLVIRA